MMPAIRRSHFLFRLPASLCATAVVLFSGVLGYAQSPAIIPEISISQDSINAAGGPTLRKIVESGRHLFSTPFTTTDGYGEGGALDEFSNRMAGPREQSFNANIVRMAQEIGIDPRREPGKVAKLLQKFNHPLNTAQDPQGNGYPFLRLNGLDSQSCFECHNSIGSDYLTDTSKGSSALGRKASVSGGPAGFASNAFINPNLPNPLIMFVRNPPHMLGSGYTQRLAEEMTEDLLYLKKLAAYKAAMKPLEWISQPLSTHGVDFGELRVRYGGPAIKTADAPPAAANLSDLKARTALEKSMSAMPEAVRSAIDRLIAEPQSFRMKSDKPQTGDAPEVKGAARAAATAAKPLADLFEVDPSGLDGVSEDLVVRPFQWKGIASNMRNFVRDALNFHFGMLTVESEETEDEDRDGVRDEVSVGNVTALTAFAVCLRPPVTAEHWDPVERQPDAQRNASAERGKQLFTGTAGGISEARSCVFCHKQLTIRNQTVTIRDPRDREEHLIGPKAALSTQRRSSRDLPVVQRFIREFGTSPNDLSFPLDLEGQGKMPTFTQDRLTVDEGLTLVPLFSDLKRHDMGEGLSDQFDQQTDVEGIVVPKRQFLTRPLWGVADTGPWLHDGRALSLRQAILLHESPGSEANDSIEAFRGLSDDDQQAIIDFLLTLRLPTDPRYGSDDPR